MGPIDLVRLGLREAPIVKLFVAVASVFALVVVILGWSQVPPLVLVVGALIMIALAFILALLSGLTGIFRQAKYQHHFIYPLVAMIWGMSVAFILVIFLLIYSAFSSGLKGTFGEFLGSIEKAFQSIECDSSKMSTEEYLKCKVENSP